MLPHVCSRVLPASFRQTGNAGHALIPLALNVWSRVTENRNVKNHRRRHLGEVLTRTQGSTLVFHVLDQSNRIVDELKRVASELASLSESGKPNAGAPG